MKSLEDSLLGLSIEYLTNLNKVLVENSLEDLILPERFKDLSPNAAYQYGRREVIYSITSILDLLTQEYRRLTHENKEV